MNDLDPPRLPLGIADLAGRALSGLISRWWLIFAVSLIVYFAAAMLNYGIFGDFLFTTESEDFSRPYVVFTIFCTYLSITLASVIVTAFVTLVVCDADAARPVTVKNYFGSLARSMVRLLLLTIVICSITAIAILALVIPAIYLGVIWSVAVPILVIENTGMSCLGRSAALTRGYRWPILGLVIFMTIASLLFTVTGSALMGAGMFFDNTNEFSPLWLTIFDAVASSVTAAPFASMTAILYVRLMEINGGVGNKAMVDVFA